MDELAAGDSFLHRVHPLWKLLLTLWYLVLTASFPRYALSGLLGMSLYWISGFSIADLSLREALARTRWILGALFLVGIANPLLDRVPVLTLAGVPVSGGMISLATLFVKGLFAALASYLLIATTTLEEICWAMRLLRIPKLPVTVTMLTYRYLVLLMQEARRMSLACGLRCPGEKGVPFSIWGAFAGQMLLRTMERGERVYESMTLRGFHGEFPPPSRGTVRGGFVWFVLWLCALAFVRAAPIFELAGRRLFG
ncbi:MAG: energy-coupling factor transporter transmembrane protein EcfT [Oscillibacter sp.]|nr:energy-coupling factor transporter transmembrane protein EcfT [Oscillibacter sp.]